MAERESEQNCELLQTADGKAERSRAISEGIETIKLTGKHDAAPREISGLTRPGFAS